MASALQRFSVCQYMRRLLAHLSHSVFGSFLPICHQTFLGIFSFLFVVGYCFTSGWHIRCWFVSLLSTYPSNYTVVFGRLVSFCSVLGSVLCLLPHFISFPDRLLILRSPAPWSFGPWPLALSPGPLAPGSSPIHFLHYLAPLLQPSRS